MPADNRRDERNPDDELRDAADQRGNSQPAGRARDRILQVRPLVRRVRLPFGRVVRLPRRRRVSHDPSHLCHSRVVVTNLTRLNPATTWRSARSPARNHGTRVAGLTRVSTFPPGRPPAHERSWKFFSARKKSTLYAGKTSAIK